MANPVTIFSSSSSSSGTRSNNGSSSGGSDSRIGCSGSRSTSPFSGEGNSSDGGISSDSGGGGGDGGSVSDGISERDNNTTFSANSRSTWKCSHIAPSKTAGEKQSESTNKAPGKERRRGVKLLTWVVVVMRVDESFGCLFPIHTTQEKD